MGWFSLRIGAILAMIGSVIDLLVAPFHGAAYFNTRDGGEDLLPFQRAWGEALREAAPAAFDFAGPDGVYLTYGRITSIAFVLFALGFVALHGAQLPSISGWRRNVGHVAVGTWGLLGVSAMAEYYTPFTDQIFLVAGPSLLLTIILTTIYGFTTSNRGGLPPRMPRSLAIAAIAFIPLVALLGHLPLGGYGFSIAWILIGTRVIRTPPADSLAALPRLGSPMAPIRRGR